MILDVRERVRDLGSQLRYMLRRSSLVECVIVLHGTCLQCVEIFLSIGMCSHVCQKVHILYHKKLTNAKKKTRVRFVYVLPEVFHGVFLSQIKYLVNLE